MESTRIFDSAATSSSPSIAYLGPNGMAPKYDFNTTIFQRPYGLAQWCRLHFFTMWHSSVSQEILDLVTLHRAPRARSQLSRVTYFLFCLARLFHLRKQLQAVYTPAGTAVFVGWVARSLLRVKWIVEYCDHPYFDAICAYQDHRYVSWLLYYARTTLSRPLVRRADLVVCTGHRGLINSLALPDKKIVVQPNGVEIRRCITGPSRKTSPRLRIVYVGLVSRVRGAGLMLESMHLLQEIGCPAELTILGPWNRRDTQWIEEKMAGLEGKVTVTGRVNQDRVAAVLAEADVGLFPFPPREEVKWIYPIKIYEYMALGVLPVCTDLVGVRDIVQDGVSGFILRSASSTDLCQILARLAANRPLVEKMRGAARKRAEVFDWPRIHRDFCRDLTRRLGFPAQFEAPIPTSAAHG